MSYQDKIEALGNDETGWDTTAAQIAAEADAEIGRLRAAIQACLEYANGRQSEWGERAEAAFRYLEEALHRST